MRMIIDNVLKAKGGGAVKMADSTHEPSRSGGQTLAPTSAYGGGQHSSGYHSPDPAIARSSSPGSGSFHTANPIDSERSSLTGDGEDWQRESDDDLSSIEIPSLEEMPTLVASSQGQGRPDKYSTPQQEEDEDERDVTLHNQSSLSLGVASGSSSSRVGMRGQDTPRNWINQPKLEPAESETVPPCPRKRPLHEASEYQGPPVLPPPESETTPLLSLPSNRQSQSRDRDRECCTLL